MKISIPCNYTTSFCLDFVTLNAPEPLHLQCCASRHAVHCGRPLKTLREQNKRPGELTVTEA